MVITVPSADEIDRYGAGLAPDTRGALGIPRIADGEAVCLVRVLDTGAGAYWSRGDVDVHVLHARQQGLTAGMAHQAWLAEALRERREQRRHLQRSGVQTTASGLVVLHAPARLVVPGRT
jgi:hypothetical protein